MAKKKQGVIGRLLSYGDGYQKYTVAGSVLAGISAVLALIPYLFIWRVINEALILDGGSADYDQMIRDGWMAVLFAAINIVVYFAGLMMTHFAAFHIAGNMRVKGMRHLISLPLGYFDGQESGRLRKIVDDNAALTEDLLAHKIPDMIASFITPAAAIVILVLFDWRMGLVCILLMILALVTMFSMMGGKNAGFYRKYQDANEKISGQAVEYVRGIPVVKTFQQTIYSFRAFHKAITECSELAHQYAMSCRIGQTFFLTINNGSFFVLILMAILLAESSEPKLLMSNFIFYALFAPACSNTLNRGMYATQAIRDATEAVVKLDEIESVTPQRDGMVSSMKPAKNVSFDDVSFAYSDDEPDVLKNISFDTSGGSLTAIVGPSGGGKSTIAKLIPRFYDPESGNVMLDDNNVQVLSLRNLMEQVSFVFQSSELFKISVRDNLLIGKPDAADEEIRMALTAASCIDIIEKLPNGINTIIGTRGTYLSGGEVQRIALARVFLKNAPFVVLDEATAFADPGNESQIQDAISEITKEKNVVMIAHRIPTVQFADQILVIDKGKIAERGNHAMLMEKDGLYRKMWDEYETSVSWKIGKEGQQ